MSLLKLLQMVQAQTTQGVNLGLLREQRLIQTGNGALRLLDLFQMFQPQLAKFVNFNLMRQYRSV